MIDDQGMNSERKCDMHDKGERQWRLEYENQTEMNPTDKFGRCSWTTRNSPSLHWMAMKYYLINGQKIIQSGIPSIGWPSKGWLVQLFAPWEVCRLPSRHSISMIISKKIRFVIWFVSCLSWDAQSTHWSSFCYCWRSILLRRPAFCLKSWCFRYSLSLSWRDDWKVRMHTYSYKCILRVRFSSRPFMSTKNCKIYWEFRILLPSLAHPSSTWVRWHSVATHAHTHWWCWRKRRDFLMLADVPRVIFLFFINQRDMRWRGEWSRRRLWLNNECVISRG